MAKAADIRAQAERLMARFTQAGATRVETPVLQPAATLLDLYGEDIRGRAYVTSDVLRGEQMLRPDFTVPVVQQHMSNGGDTARYTYSGPVFRRQDSDETRPNEYHQVGYEYFTHHEVADADAQVFALFYDLLAPLDLRVVTGDIGLLIAAVEGLQTSDARKRMLRRHIWRPKRFRALLDLYAKEGALSATLAGQDPFADAGPFIGLRTQDQISARIAALQEDTQTERLSAEELALIDAILAISGPADTALIALSAIADDYPPIRKAVEKLDQRLLAVAVRGTAAHAIEFEASYGRTQMEYYDGFVFGFHARTDLPAIASGGRYDALTRQLGGGREIPAVGGVMRPGLICDLGGLAC